MSFSAGIHSWTSIQIYFHIKSEKSLNDLVKEWKTDREHDSKQIYFVVCALQLELWEFKYHILACELLVDTREGLNLKQTQISLVS